MRHVCHSLGHASLFLTFAKSDDITNIFVKSILVQKIALTSIYDIIMSPEPFLNKEQRFAPIHYDYIRVW